MARLVTRDTAWGGRKGPVIVGYDSGSTSTSRLARPQGVIGLPVKKDGATIGPFVRDTETTTNRDETGDVVSTRPSDRGALTAIRPTTREPVSTTTETTTRERQAPSGSTRITDILSPAPSAPNTATPTTPTPDANPTDTAPTNTNPGGGGDNIADILGSIFAGLNSGDTGAIIPSETPAVMVSPRAPSNGGSNTLLILALIGAAIGGYYLWRRSRKD